MLLTSSQEKQKQVVENLKRSLQYGKSIEAQKFISSEMKEISNILANLAEEYSNTITIEVFINSVRKIKNLRGKENFEKFINELDEVGIDWSYAAKIE
jgi:hypothetical protein